MATHDPNWKDQLFELVKPILPAKLRGDIPIVPVVRLTGVIGESGMPLRASVTLAATAKVLERAFKTRHARAVAIVINSPGGSPVQSHLIYRRIRELAAEHTLPVIAFVEDVAASGGYMVACAADEIVCDPSSIVGSIGVIMEWTNYGDLLKWAKLKPEVLKAGSLKDAGSPTREMTPEERAYFQSLVDNMHTQFIRDVAAGRKIDVEKLTPLATGQVWTGQQALPLHLIDKQGGFRDALLDTAKQVGISGEPNVVKPPKKGRSVLDLVTTDADDLFPNPQQLLEKHAGFYFLWR